MAEPDPDRERRFLELVEANRGSIGRISRAYAGQDWRDLQQDILLQVWKGLDRFEGRSSASTWIYRVALNTALTWRRRPGSSSRPDAEPMSAVEDAVGPAGHSPVALLQDFLQSLDRVDRAILLLYLDDASYDDIAGVTGLTKSHVGVRLHRIKRDFKARYIG